MSLDGLQLGRYRLLRLLGSGGMGKVYLAEDVPIHRQVAIKVIQTEVSPYPNAESVKEVERLFQREAKAISALDHPHILPLYDYGEETINGTTFSYLVMPYRPEGSLATWLRQLSSSSLPSSQDVAYFIHQAADALQHAHDHQIIHQDIKPANFLLRRNNENPARPDLFLADFGIAKFNTATASASQNVRGTPSYMAPEQLDGHPIPASDQYALAIMAYELLTGRPPFQGNLSQVIYQHFHAQPPLPSTLNARLPRDVDIVLLHALAKSPAARFASVSAFARAFQGALQETDVPTIENTDLRNTSRSGDVYATLAISEMEAHNGARRTLTLPGGQPITVSVPAGAHDGQVLYIKDPASPGGSLILTLVIRPVQQHQAATLADEDSATIGNSPTVPSEANKSSAPGNPASRLNRGGPIPDIAPPALSQSGSMTGSKSSMLPGSRIMLLIGLALLVILAGMGAFLLFTHQSGSGGTGVQVGTATASAATTSSSNPYPPNTGTVALDDPLTNNNQGYNWEEGTNNNHASCSFTASGLDVTQPKQQYFHGCIAQATNFTNFAYEVQMKMISGDYSGIIFCANKASGNYYFFYVKPTGDYALRILSSNQFIGSFLRQGSSPAIHIGLPASNTIAVVVQHGTITLYVNQTMIDSVNDSTYTQGQIGVFTGNDVNAAETVFTKAKVWSI